jgi:hypothetical protein
MGEWRGVLSLLMLWWMMVQIIVVRRRGTPGLPPRPEFRSEAGYDVTPDSLGLFGPKEVHQVIMPLCLSLPMVTTLILHLPLIINFITITFYTPWWLHRP